MDVHAAIVLHDLGTEVYLWVVELIFQRFRGVPLDMTTIDLAFLRRGKLEAKLVEFINVVVYTIQDVTPSVELFRRSLAYCTNVPSRLITLLCIPLDEPSLIKTCLQEYYACNFTPFWSRSDAVAAEILGTFQRNREHPSGSLAPRGPGELRFVDP
jgi:hypothetical protein